MQKPTIAIIGPGRAGSALGRALHQAGYTIAAIGGRNPDNVRNLASELGAKACQSPATAIDLADLTILAVPDDAISETAAFLSRRGSDLSASVAFHLSGALPAEAIAPLLDLSQVLYSVGNKLGIYEPFEKPPRVRFPVATLHAFTRPSASPA